MHPLYRQADPVSNSVIGGAIEVHRDKGPGLIESIYERCLMHEIALRGFAASSQQEITIRYKDTTFQEILRYDILVDHCLLLELKSVERIVPIHKAKLLSYMKLLNVPLGLIISFNVTRLVDGLSRLILPGAGSDASLS